VDSVSNPWTVSPTRGQCLQPVDSVSNPWTLSPTRGHCRIAVHQQLVQQLYTKVAGPIPHYNLTLERNGPGIQLYEMDLYVCMRELTHELARISTLEKRNGPGMAGGREGSESLSLSRGTGSGLSNGHGAAICQICFSVRSFPPPAGYAEFADEAHISFSSLLLE
jgi:hypothetical protein